MADAFDHLAIIGDEIHFDGELVAIMTDNAAPTHRDRFTDALENGTTGGDTDEAILEKLNRLSKDMQQMTKGGLIRAADFARLIGRIKEDYE